MAKKNAKVLENLNENTPQLVEEKPNKAKKKNVVLEPVAPVLTIVENEIPLNKKPKTSNKSKMEEPTHIVEEVPEDPKIEVKPKRTKKVKEVKEEPAPIVEEVPEDPKIEVKPKRTKKVKEVKEEPAPIVEEVPEDPKVEVKPKKLPNKDKTKDEIQEEQKPYTGQVRYSDEDLAHFESIILNAKKDAMEELRMLKERLEDLNSYDLAEESMIYSMHMGEQGNEPAEKEKTYAQIQRINEYLLKLDDALKRISDKTYGICQKCNILIARERLEAVPITTQSASWKIHKKCPKDGIDRIVPLL